MNKTIIFDFDGTLLDSLPDITFNINKMLKKFGFQALDNQTIRSFIGNGAKQLVKDCIGQNISEQLFNQCLNFYNSEYTSSACVYSKPFDGVYEMLSTLKQEGYKLCILTNKPQQTTNPIYEKFFSRFEFDCVIGQRDNIKCKPDKTATLNILKKLNTKLENAFFVGDGETDVITAINAGIKGIAILWGYRNKEQLALAGATTFAENPNELLKIIKNG